MNTSLLLTAMLAAPLCAVLPAITAAQAAQTARTGLGGTYTATTEDGPASLTLFQDGGGNITGTLRTGGASGTLKGRGENGRATGLLTYGNAALPFEINQEEGALYFHLGNQELTFKASNSAVAVAAAPRLTASAKPSAAVKPASAPLTAPPTAPAGWKVLHNPIGATFRYPASWNLAEVNGFLFLVPPGVEVPAGGVPSEMYLVLATPAPGISRVNDPRLLQMADGLVGQLFPYLRRSGDGETAPISGGASGLIVTYDGTNPTTGKPSRIRSYAIVHNGMLMQIQALGERDKVAARDAVLRQIYGSITTSPSEHDGRLVGIWAGNGTSNERVKTDGGGRLRSSVSSESSSTYTLQRDGTLVVLTTSRSSITLRGSHDLPESQRADALLDTGDKQQAKQGHWYAGNGKVVLVMDDGTGVMGDYQVAGSILSVRYAGGTTQQFQRSF